MNTSKAKNEGRDMKERAKCVQLAAPSAPGEQSFFNMVGADDFDENQKMNGMDISQAKQEERSAKERSKGVKLAPPFAPLETYSRVLQKLRRKNLPDNVTRICPAAKDDEETKPGHVVAGLPSPTPHCIEEEQQLLATGSSSNDGKNAPATMLVEANLAPELMMAEEVNIHEEEARINKKILSQHIFRFAMVFYGIAIIFNFITFAFLFVNQGRVWDSSFGNPFSLTLAVCCFLVLATMTMFLPTTRCGSLIRLEEYTPDDKQILRSVQIASVASLLISCGVIPILELLPNLPWLSLGYALMTCALAGTVFALVLVRLLQHSKEARKEKSKAFWALFVVCFIVLCSAAVWRCRNPVYSEEHYPDCHVDNRDKIGDGYCDGAPYMTVECGYDGGDCVEFLDKYPGCIVDQPYRVGDGICDLCDLEPYASPRASSGNCSNCVQFPLSCSPGAYNTKACGYDGGDCDAVNEWYPSSYPDCHVENPSRIGDGRCDGRLYGTIECNFDGGDCLKAGERCRGHRECASEICNPVTKVCDSGFVSELYPNCSVGMPHWIGDGKCDGGVYASEACGFDGGDCPER